MNVSTVGFSNDQGRPGNTEPPLRPVRLDG